MKWLLPNKPPVNIMGESPPPPAVFMEREPVGGWLFQINCGKGLKWRQLCDQRPCASYPTRDLAQAIVAQEYQRNRRFTFTFSGAHKFQSSPSIILTKKQHGQNYSKKEDKHLSFLPSKMEMVCWKLCSLNYWR